MLQPGQSAPDFTLPDDSGTPRNLGELLADGPLILYFYPADFTPGCTREACSLRDQFPVSSAAGITIAGVSPQSPESHARFRAHHRLPFTLLADEAKTVIKAYDADGPFGFGVRRVTYLIGQDRIIRDAVLADFRIGRHLTFVQNAINDG